MKAITFEQFINTFNFRDINEYAQSEREQRDTKIIRIYIDDDMCNWFELGVYDFGIRTWELIQRCLNAEICKSYVGSITYDTNIDVLKVYLQKASELILD